MRPPRDDIGAPELPADLEWIGNPPHSMAALAASGPVLVHFIDLWQLNSVRTLPYISEWHRRYRDHGLSVIAVQAPRLEFGSGREAVARQARRLELETPVAIDVAGSLWLDYGCEGWPSLFLWGLGGALRWFHFGEGEYRATEEAIQEELRESDALRALPEPMQPLRATDAPGATVIAPTEELFPAGERPWTAQDDGASLTVEYEAGGAHATVDGKGRLSASLDGGPPVEIAVNGPGLYALAEHPVHGGHRLDLELAGEAALWSVSFAPGVPAAT